MTKKPSINPNSHLRWCDDLAMFAWERSRKSCVHRTKFCDANCYNKKLYRTFTNMTIQESALEQAWPSLSGKFLCKQLNRKRKQVQRVRGCTRGETFNSLVDVFRIETVLLHNPNTVFWIPTRAWRKPSIKKYIESLIFPYKNARVQASMDPSNTYEEWHMVVNAGWSTIFFGDDSMTETPLGNRMIKCAKTHKKLKGVCSTCQRGCFSKNQNHVHLKQH